MASYGSGEPDRRRFGLMERSGPFKILVSQAGQSAMLAPSISLREGTATQDQTGYFGGPYFADCLTFSRWDLR